MTKSYIGAIEEKIIRKIILLRNERVILDIHLAELYGVETRILKQAVKRNLDRFPNDFMFVLENNEIDLGGASPFAFTETGVAMLSSILKSRASISMNIEIMRTFVALRKVASNYQEIMQIIISMRGQYDAQFEQVYQALEKLINPPVKPRPRIGFRRKDEE
jgi:hypothetical protein